jgi:hypothetical protein
LDRRPSTNTAYVRRRQHPDIAAAATATATNLATTLATTTATATTKQRWLQQGTTAEARRAAMAVVMATHHRTGKGWY